MFDLVEANFEYKKSYADDIACIGVFVSWVMLHLLLTVNTLCGEFAVNITNYVVLLTGWCGRCCY